MSYVPKHAAVRQPKLGVRVAGIATVAGAALISGLASSPAAEAAPGVWDKVASCESGGDWSVNTGNGYYGGLQFSASSWRAAGGAKFASMPHQASKSEQIATAQNLLRMQGPGAWPVCSRKAGLTRANGLASGGGADSSGSSDSSDSTAARADLTRSQRRVLNNWLGLNSGASSTATIVALQKRAGVSADGVVGSQTVRGVERMVGASRSGASYFTPATISALMEHVQG